MRRAARRSPAGSACAAPARSATASRAVSRSRPTSSSWPTCRATSSGRRCATTSASRPSRSRAGCDTSDPSSTSTSSGARVRPASAGRSPSPPCQPADETMTDLIARPNTTQTTVVQPHDDSLAERLLTTQSPQRPQSTPRIRIEVDGRVVEGFEGQTILEVCRDNGIEIPTLCYEPKLPGFGACRMCVVDLEGEEHPPISCSRTCEDGMKVQTQTDDLRRLRRTNLELIFSDHNAYCLPPCQNKCPSHIDIPGFLKANAEGNFRESSRIFKRTIPFPSVLGRVCPAPCEEHCRRDEVDEAIAIRDSHRYAGDQVLKAMLDEGIDPPVPFEQKPRTGRRVAVIGSGPAGMAAAYYLLIAGHDVTVFERDAAPGGMLRYGIPKYRLPKVEVLEAEYESVTRLGGKIVCNAELGKDFGLDDLQNQGFDAVVVAI